MLDGIFAFLHPGVPFRAKDTIEKPCFANYCIAQWIVRLFPPIGCILQFVEWLMSFVIDER